MSLVQPPFITTPCISIFFGNIRLIEMHTVHIGVFVRPIQFIVPLNRTVWNFVQHRVHVIVLLLYTMLDILYALWCHRQELIDVWIRVERFDALGFVSGDVCC